MSKTDANPRNPKASAIDWKAYPRTVAEKLLEPNSRGLATPPVYILGVLRGSKNEETFRALDCEIARILNREFELAAHGKSEASILRYVSEREIVTKARDMLAGLLWGGQAR